VKIINHTNDPIQDNQIENFAMVATMQFLQNEYSGRAKFLLQGNYMLLFICSHTFSMPQTNPLCIIQSVQFGMMEKWPMDAV